MNVPTMLAVDRVKFVSIIIVLILLNNVYTIITVIREKFVIKENVSVAVAVIQIVHSIVLVTTANVSIHVRFKHHVVPMLNVNLFSIDHNVVVHSVMMEILTIIVNQ